MNLRGPRASMLVGIAATCLLACGQARCAGAPSGFSAPELYNAANGYARAGKTGLAVLFYERAQWLAPGDADVAANLHLVRVSARLPDPTPSAFERILTWTAPDTFAWLGVFGLISVGVGVLTRRQARRAGGWSLLLIGGGVLCVALTLANAAVLWPRLNDAVVLMAAASVRATPAPMGDELFQIPEGDSVRVEAEHEDFLFVRTPQGREGWVARAAVALVVPR